jgi:hypothetical protein
MARKPLPDHFNWEKWVWNYFSSPRPGKFDTALNAPEVIEISNTSRAKMTKQTGVKRS